MENTVKEEAERLIREAPEIPYVSAIISCLNKIADKGATIADIAINRALQQPNKDVENIVHTVKHTRVLPFPKVRQTKHA